MNPQNSFLIRLTERLAAGWRGVEPERAARHRDFMLGFQRADGGFAGRDGGSDLYYTSFAVRGLALLDALDDARSRLLSNYLKSAAARGRYSLIDRVSWFYSAITLQWTGRGAVFEGSIEAVSNELSSALETFRRTDGGYAKTHEGGVGSTYHTFLAVLCYEMLGMMPPDTA